jgi:hypothetical protein
MDRSTASARQARYYNTFSRQDTEEGKQTIAKRILMAFAKLSSRTKKVRTKIKTKLHILCPIKKVIFTKTQIDIDDTVGTQECLSSSNSLPIPPSKAVRVTRPGQISNYLKLPDPTGNKRYSSCRIRPPLYDPIHHGQQIIMPVTKYSLEEQAINAPIPPVILTHENMRRGYWYVPSHLSSKEALALMDMCEDGEEVEELRFDAPM